MKRPCSLLMLAAAVLGLYGCLSSPSTLPSRTPARARPPAQFLPTAAPAEPKAWLGIEMIDADPLLMASFGAENRPGVLVTGTTLRSPAMVAGISAGDVIVQVNDTRIENTRQMVEMVGSSSPGTALRIEIVRNFRVGIFTVALGKPRPAGPLPPSWPGFIVGMLNEATRAELNLPLNARGVPVMHLSPTPIWAGTQQAARKVPQRGDLIVEAGGLAINEPYDLYRAINRSLQNRIPIRFVRGEKESFVMPLFNPFLTRNKIVNTWADPPLSTSARQPAQAATPRGTAMAPVDRETLPLLSVLDFKTDELAKAQVWIVVDVLSGALVDTRRFRVLERSQRDKLLKEVESTASEAFDDAHQLKIGKLIAADNIVIGSLAKIEGNYILSLKLVEVETGETRSAAFKSFENLNAVVEGCPELARKLGEY